MKKKGLKEAVVRAMNNFTCSVFSGRNQHECVTLEKEAKDFFTDANVMARVLNPQSYFQQITTVAFKEVKIFLSVFLFFVVNEAWMPSKLKLSFSSLQQTEAERKVPFAFSILNHSNLGLLEALLSVIFRPHNAYCIYIDAKAADSYKVSFTSFVACATYVLLGP